MLAHRNHAQFLIRKLWAEFIASPIPQATLDSLISTYKTSGFKLKPLLRAILNDARIFESIDEPNLIKPPMVYMIGALRQLGAPLKGTFMQGAMNNMQQRVYRPPNVAGWEGGMSWLNTNTVLGRWDLINRVQYLQVLDVLRGDDRAPGATSRPRRRRRPTTAPTSRSTGRGSRPDTVASIKAYAARRRGDLRGAAAPADLHHASC